MDGVGVEVTGRHRMPSMVGRSRRGGRAPAGGSGGCDAISARTSAGQRPDRHVDDHPVVGHPVQPEQYVPVARASASGGTRASPRSRRPGIRRAPPDQPTTPSGPVSPRSTTPPSPSVELDECDLEGGDPAGTSTGIDRICSSARSSGLQWRSTPAAGDPSRCRSAPPRRRRPGPAAGLGTTRTRSPAPAPSSGTTVRTRSSSTSDGHQDARAQVLDVSTSPSTVHGPSPPRCAYSGRKPTRTSPSGGAALRPGRSPPAGTVFPDDVERARRRSGPGPGSSASSR